MPQFVPCRLGCALIEQYLSTIKGDMFFRHGKASSRLSPGNVPFDKYNIQSVGIYEMPTARLECYGVLARLHLIKRAQT